MRFESTSFDWWQAFVHLKQTLNIISQNERNKI